MRWRPRSLSCLAALCACGGAQDPSDAPRGAEPNLGSAGSDAGGAGSVCPGTELTQIAPLQVDDGSGDPSSSEAPRFTRFVDPRSGCVTDQVHDAGREIVFFDRVLGAMVSLEGGAAVSGWSVDGDALGWTRSGVRFQVRFGSEGGARRAFFTEAGPGTICDLTLAGPDVLFIRATSETPPDP